MGPLKRIREKGLGIHPGYAKALKQLEKAERAVAANAQALGRQEETLRAAEEKAAEEKAKTFIGMKADQEGARAEVTRATQSLLLASAELRTVRKALDLVREQEKRIRKEAEEQVGGFLRELHGEAVGQMGKAMRTLAQCAAAEREVREIGMEAFSQPNQPASEHRIVQFLRPLPPLGEELGDPSDPNSRIAIWLEEAAQHGYKA